MLPQTLCAENLSVACSQTQHVPIKYHHVQHPHGSSQTAHHLGRYEKVLRGKLLTMMHPDALGAASSFIPHAATRNETTCPLSNTQNRYPHSCREARCVDLRTM